VSRGRASHRQLHQAEVHQRCRAADPVAKLAEAHQGLVLEPHGYSCVAALARDLSEVGEGRRDPPVVADLLPQQQALAVEVLGLAAAT